MCILIYINFYQHIYINNINRADGELYTVKVARGRNAL